MKLVLQTPDCAVYDDVLSSAVFAAVWSFTQREDYTTPFHSGRWQKVWRVTDSYPLSGPQYVYSRRPFGNALDQAVESFLELAAAHPEIVDASGCASIDLSMRPYLYPRGTKLSWHDDDKTVYRGAMIYYAHQRWSPHWGGELFIADPPPAAYEPLPDGPHLDHSAQDEYLMQLGTGRYIVPKPNRLVLLRSDTFHMLARIDPDAGNHVRCSIAGFFHAL